MRPFPMPNDKLGGGTVVASVWYDDDNATVLLLMPEVPYFVVTLYDLISGRFTPITRSENIVPAIREYEEWGGDY